MLRLEVFGKAQIRRRGQTLPVSGTKMWSLLGLLALQYGRPVETLRIAEASWPGRRLCRPQASVQVLVSRLRSRLGADRGAVVTDGTAYLLDPAIITTDLSEFLELARRGAAALAQGRAGDAASALGRALAVWRTDPLEKAVPHSHAWPELENLRQVRDQVLLDRIDADLALGHQADVIPLLRTLWVERPLQPRLRRQLAVALDASGRREEARRMGLELIDPTASHPFHLLHRNIERTALTAFASALERAADFAPWDRVGDPAAPSTQAPPRYRYEA